MAGKYAVSIQWGAVLRNLGLSLASTYVAVVMRNFHLDNVGVKRQIVNGMYALAAMMSLATGFVIGSSETLMTIWLGPGFAGTGYVMFVAAAPTALTATVAPVYALCLASGRVLYPGLVICCAGLLYIAAFVGLEKMVGVGPFGLAAIAAGVYLAHLFAVSLPYAAAQIGATLLDFGAPILSAIAWTAVAALFSHWTSSQFKPTSFLELGACGVLLAPAYAAVVAVTLPRAQRSNLSPFLQHVASSVADWRRR